MTLLPFLAGVCAGALITAAASVLWFYWCEAMELERMLVDLHDEFREDYNTWCKKGGGT